MPKLDPFSAQIVQLVREMPDDAILELVRNKLGAQDENVAPAASAPARSKTEGRAKATRRKKASSKRKASAKKKAAPEKKAAPKKKAAAKKRRPKKKAATKKKAVAKKAAPKKRAGKKKKRGGGDRQRELEVVERAIRSSKGLSASEIVKRTKLPRARVSAAVRQLKDAKRIAQGGDRRFARYAADAKTALAASEQARNTASGPRRKR